MPAMIMKTTIVHCAQAPNGSMERALGEKPPAESVVNAWQTALKRSMPGARSSRPSDPERSGSPAPVKNAYSSQNRLAVSRMRGASLSNCGPGTSRVISWRPPTASRGSTASTSTMMPRPPSHCVRLRQNRIARPWLSMSSMLLAPVAVTPGHRLEERVDRRGDVAALDHVRHRREHGGGEPHQRHRQEAVVRPQRPRAGRQTAQGEADREAAREAGRGTARARRRRSRRERRGDEQRQAEDGEQGADEAADGTPVDAHQRRQYARVSSTSTGISSSRPIHISTIIVERRQVGERREGAERARRTRSPARRCRSSSRRRRRRRRRRARGRARRRRSAG